MKVYIVQLDEGLKILKIEPENEAAFLQEYQSCIIATGASIQDVILQFAKMKEETGE